MLRYGESYSAVRNGTVNFDIGYQTVDKRGSFEKFLTYKRRLSRMAVVQGLFMLDMHKYVFRANPTQISLFAANTDELKPEIFCRSMIYLYKNYLLDKNSYGNTSKNKKIDERFLFSMVKFVYENLAQIDNSISSQLSKKRSIDKIDFLVRSILRCAIGEKLLFGKPHKEVLISEYTNLASYFFTGKEIGFINGVLESYCKNNK